MPTAVFHMIVGAPQPVAPYSHAVESDGWIFITGQISNDPEDDMAPLPEGIEAQTHRVLNNLKRVLGGLGLGLDTVLSVRIFLAHFREDYAAMNAVYAGYFPPNRRPARTCIGVTDLARDARIEIDCMARRP
jgi:reactive intermediate/imine deaminase